MQTGSISFCDGLAYNIRSDDTKRAVLARLASWGIEIIRRHHTRFEGDSSVAAINAAPHLVSVRTNGNPYLLFLTRHEYVNTCIFVDKKVQHGYTVPRMVVARLGFDDALFQGTVLDGEMVRVAPDDWVFVVNEVLVSAGESLAARDLLARVDLAYALLEGGFTPRRTDPFRVQVKRYFRVTEMGAMLQEFVPGLPYTCRGVYFTPVAPGGLAILLNNDDSLIKTARNAKERTVVVHPVSKVEGGAAPVPAPEVPPAPAGTSTSLLFARKTATVDVYELFAGKRDAAGGRRPVGHLSVRDIRSSLALQAAFDSLNCVQLLRVRCVPTAAHPAVPRPADPSAAPPWAFHSLPKNNNPG